jgi:integrase
MAGRDYERQAVGHGVFKVIRKADGAWTSTVVYYRTADRRQHVKTFTGPDTLTVAKRFKADIDRKDPEQRVDPSLGRKTLGAVYDQQMVSRSFSAKTLSARSDIRRKAGLAELFATPIARITRTQVREAIAGTTTSPGMAREIRKALSSAFGYAMEELGVELPKGNPASGSGLKKTTSEVVAEGNTDEPKRVLSRDEIRRLIAEMPERYQALVELLARVGLRPGEAYGLTVRQLDPIARTLTIDTAASGFTKTGKHRTIPVPTDLVETLVTHIERYASWNADALVFTSESGNAIDEHNWRRRVFQPASQRAGVNHGLRPYDLRHTALSKALMLGIDPATVANMAGHDVKTLYRHYTHAMDEAKKRAADVLGAAWNAAPLSQDAEVVPVR